MDTEMIKCGICGVENPSASTYCASCGSYISTKERPVVIEIPRFKKRLPRMSPLVVVRNTLLLLLSVILLLVNFLPVVKMDYGDVDASLEGFEVAFTPFEMVILFTDNLRSLDEEELNDSELNDRIADHIEELFSEIAGNEYIETFDDLTREQKKKVEKLVHLVVRLALQSEESKFRWPMAASFGVTVIYALLSVLVFVFALINLIVYLVRRGGLYRISVLLASIAVMLIPLTYFLYSVALTGSGGYSSIESVTIAIDPSEILEMSEWMLLPFVSLGAFALYQLVERIILNRDSFGLRKCAVSLMTLVLAVAIICMAFVPSFGVALDTEFAGGVERETETYLSPYHFSNYIITTEEIEEVVDHVEDISLKKMLTDYSEYTSGQVRRGEIDGIISTMLFYTITYNVIDSVVQTYSLSLVFSAFAIACAGLLAALSVYYVSIGNGRRRWGIALGSLALVFALLYLAFNISHVSVMNVCLGDMDIEGEVFSLKLAAGSVLLAAFSLLALVLAFFNRTVRRYKYVQVDDMPTDALGDTAEAPVDTADTPVDTAEATSDAEEACGDTAESVEPEAEPDEPPVTEGE